jgi:hypothetical protein
MSQLNPERLRKSLGPQHFFFGKSYLGCPVQVVPWVGLCRALKRPIKKEFDRVFREVSSFPDSQFARAADCERLEGLSLTRSSRSLLRAKSSQIETDRDDGPAIGVGTDGHYAAVFLHALLDARQTHSHSGASG